MSEPGPLVSVFTPSHDPRYLSAAYSTLRHQTYEHWEWVVLLNGGAAWSPPAGDPRVRVISDANVAGVVGAAKARAVEECTGDLLLELDHDDLLATDAIAEVVAAFEVHPAAGLVYSHAASVDEHGRPIATVYDEHNGWTYRSANVDGLEVTYPVTFEPTPHNVALIWFAPNHLRAFSRVAYEKAGGYDPTLDVLDDQDLMCRLYEVGPFELIDRPLYLQRQHPNRTSAGPEDQPQTARNARIQSGTIELYDRYISRLALAWAERAGLPALDLGAAHNPQPGYLSVDQHDRPGVDVVCCLPERLPYDDGTVGVIRAYDFLEHVADKIALITELHRVLAPGGLLLTCTPDAAGRGAVQDPTHVALYNESSFRYYTDPNLRGYVDQLEDAGVAFQVSRLVTWPPPPMRQLADLVAAGVPVEVAIASVAADERIPYVIANLIKLPALERNGGYCAWPDPPA
jgi:hypothetical protein